MTLGYQLINLKGPSNEESHKNGVFKTVCFVFIIKIYMFIILTLEAKIVQLLVQIAENLKRHSLKLVI